MCVDFSFDEDGQIQATLCDDCVCHLDFETNERNIVLTKISATAAAVAAILNVAVLFSVDLTGDQLAAINTAILVVGGALHAWFNPAVPFGEQG